VPFAGRTQSYGDGVGRSGVETMQSKVGSFRELASLIVTVPEGLVAIDGYLGVGKSTLATEIADLLGMRCVHLDDFLLPGRQEFVRFLHWPELARALANRPVLVEGVCLLEVLGRLDVRADMLVYVDSPNPEKRTATKRTPLSQEVISYHKRFRPIDVADVIYSRLGSVRSEQPMSDDEARIDIAFIQAKTRLSITLAIGGMLALLVGLIVLLHGVTGQDQALITLASVRISASGIGGVIMITSAFWAFAAYQARPIYSRTRHSSQKYGAEQRLLDHEDSWSSTERRALEGGSIRRGATPDRP
jgi:hypothetical protein